MNTPSWFESQISSEGQKGIPQTLDYHRPRLQPSSPARDLYYGLSGHRRAYPKSHPTHPFQAHRLQGRTSCLTIRFKQSDPNPLKTKTLPTLLHSLLARGIAGHLSQRRPLVLLRSFPFPICNDDDDDGALYIDC